MAQILVRDVDESIKQKLKERATLHGVSMEEEMRTILNRTLNSDSNKPLGQRFVEYFEHVTVDEDFTKISGHALNKVPDFDA